MTQVVSLLFYFSVKRSVIVIPTAFLALGAFRISSIEAFLFAQAVILVLIVCGALLKTKGALDRLNSYRIFEAQSISVYMLMISFLVFIFWGGAEGVGSLKRGSGTEFLFVGKAIYSAAYAIFFGAVLSGRLPGWKIFQFLIISLLLGIWTGSKGSIFNVVLPLAIRFIILATKENANVSVKSVSAILISGAVVLVGILGVAQYRATGEFSPAQLLVAGSELVARQTSLQSNNFSPDKTSYILDYYDGSRRLSIDYSLSFLYAYIPRSLWETKPVVSAGQEIGEQVFGASMGRHGGGVPVDSITLYMAIFGNIGFLFGSVLIIFYIVAVNYSLRKGWLLGLPLLAASTNLLGSEIARILAGVTGGYVVLVIVAIILRFRLRIRLTSRIKL